MAKKNKYEDSEYHYNPRDVQAEAAKSAQGRTLQDQANYWDEVAYNQGKPVGTNPNALYDALSGMGNYWEGQAYGQVAPKAQPPKTKVPDSSGAGDDGVDWSLYPNGRTGVVSLDFGDLPAGSTLSGFSYGKAPEYIDPYKQQIAALTQQILGRGPFEYDYNTDPSYQQYAKAYEDAGRRAMQDTLGQMAARTGGLASSYAGSASQQAYNNYMARLADKAPELRQAAYAMYQDEGNNLRQNLAMLEGLSGTDYGRFQDTLGQWNTDRSYDTSLWRYGVEDSRYAAEQALKEAATAASLGDYSKYAALGYDTSAKTTPRYYGGGGGGSTTNSNEDLAEAAAAAGLSLDDFVTLRKLKDDEINGTPEMQAFMRDYLGYGADTESGGNSGNQNYDTDANIKRALGLPQSWSSNALANYIVSQGSDIEEYEDDGVIKFRWTTAGGRRRG